MKFLRKLSKPWELSLFEHSLALPGAMVTCESCTFENSGQRSWCEVCGAALQGTREEGQAQQQQRQGQRVCPACTSLNSAKADVCGVCDSSLDVGGGVLEHAPAETQDASSVIEDKPGAKRRLPLGYDFDTPRSAPHQKLERPAAAAAVSPVAGTEDVRKIREAKFLSAQSAQSPPSWSSSSSSVPASAAATVAQRGLRGAAAPDTPDPSQLDWTATDWVFVQNPLSGGQGREKTDAETDEVCEQLGSRFLAGEQGRDSPLGSRQLFELASALVERHPLASRSGKWLLFVGRDSIDGVWGKVKENVVSGRLGPTAKVGVAGMGFMICVYTADFTDPADVHRVLARLAAMGLVRKNGLSYKADVVTLGVGSFLDNGTFYRGILQEGAVVCAEPKHFKSKDGKGQKVKSK